MQNRPGFPTITPYIILKDARQAIEFYKAAFGAAEISLHIHADGSVQHAEIRIGDSPLMLVDENPGFPDMRSIASMGGTPVHLFLYIDDADAAFAKVVSAGAEVIMPLQDQPYGRSGGVKDPFGLTWWICSHKEV